MTKKTYTPQEAYEEDVRRRPNYHDGTPRRAYKDLPENVKDGWRKNPTPREWKSRKSVIPKQDWR